MKMRSVTLMVVIFLTTNATLSSVIRVPTDSTTIQSAILGAKDGDTIRVFSGTYRGPISVTKSLVLIGSGDTAITTILAPPDFGTNPAYNRVLAHFTSERTIVYIGGSPSVRVLMTGFTVDGLRLGPNLSESVAYSGILAERCDVTLTNNTVRNILPADSAGSTWDPQDFFNGRGIEVRGDSSTALISNNRLEQINHFNIFINATDDNSFPAVLSPMANVSGNTIVGKGVYNGGQKGIWFNAGAWGSASGNTITDLDFPNPAPEPERASGIVVRYGYLDTQHGVIIANNRVIAASAINSKGMYIQGSHDIVIGNYISGFRWNIESHDGVSLLIARDTIIGGHIGIHVTSEKSPPYADSVVIGGSLENLNVIQGQRTAVLGGFAISLSYRDSLCRGDDYVSTVPVIATYNDFGFYSYPDIRARFFERGDTTLLPYCIDTVICSPFYSQTNEVRVEKGIAREFRLDQNFPNPFNPTTTIRYGLPYASTVQVRVFNILGQQVATPVWEEQGAGDHDLKFDGSELPTGVYYYRIQAHLADGGQAGEFIQTRKLLLLR